MMMLSNPNHFPEATCSNTIARLSVHSLNTFHWGLNLNTWSLGGHPNHFETIASSDRECLCITSSMLWSFLYHTNPSYTCELVSLLTTLPKWHHLFSCPSRKFLEIPLWGLLFSKCLPSFSDSGAKGSSEQSPEAPMGHRSVTLPSPGHQCRLWGWESCYVMGIQLQFCRMNSVLEGVRGQLRGRELTTQVQGPEFHPQF
jgi:hypothetical protein